MLFVILMTITFVSCVFQHTYEPYGRNMCKELSVRLKGCCVVFKHETFSCKVSFLDNNNPQVLNVAQEDEIVFQVCLRTRTGQITCVELLHGQKVFRIKSWMKLFEVSQNGTVIYGSTQKLLACILAGMHINVGIMHSSVQQETLINIPKFAIRGKNESEICGWYSYTSSPRTHNINDFRVLKIRMCICSSGYLIKKTIDEDKIVNYTRVHMIWYGRKPTASKYANQKVDKSYKPRGINYAQIACDMIWVNARRYLHQKVQYVKIMKSEIRFSFQNNGMFGCLCIVTPSRTLRVMTKCNRLGRKWAKTTRRRQQQEGFLVPSKPWVEVYTSPSSEFKPEKLYHSVQKGHRVKLLIQNENKLVLEANILIITSHDICGYFIYLDDLLYACTSSSVVTTGKKKRFPLYKQKWYVDNNAWELIFHRKNNGRIVLGPQQDMLEKLQESHRIRVATITKEKGGVVDIVRNVVRFRLNQRTVYIRLYLEPSMHKGFRWEYCNVDIKGILTCALSAVKGSRKPVTLKRVETKWFIHK